MCACHTQVCTTLYWLGQAVAELDNYSGPKLDLGAFKHLMEDIVGQIHCAHSLPAPSPTPSSPSSSLPPFLILFLPPHSLPRTLISRIMIVSQKRKKMHLQQPIMSRRRANPLISRRRANPLVSRRRANPLVSRRRANPLASRRRANPLVSRRRVCQINSKR